MKFIHRTVPAWNAVYALTAIATSAIAWAAPASAISLSGNIGQAKAFLSGASDEVQLVHARRYRHCHGSRRCHGRGEYYRYTPTPLVYVPRFYAPYGYGGYGYGYGSSWGYGGFGGQHYGHHFGGHHGGHFGGHHGGHH